MCVKDRQMEVNVTVDRSGIRCTNINVYYGDKQAIKNDSLYVGRHEIITMIAQQIADNSPSCVATMA
jgi:ABC-type phosphate transport system ATPase subunit